RPNCHSEAKGNWFECLSHNDGKTPIPTSILSTPKRGRETAKSQLTLSGVSVEKLELTDRRIVFHSRLFLSSYLWFPLRAPTTFSVGRLVRNRISRFRFSTVAAR